MDRAALVKIGIPFIECRATKLVFPEEKLPASSKKPVQAKENAPPKKNVIPTSGKEEAKDGPTNFLQEIIEKDLAEGGRCCHRVGMTGDVIRTRFPPEPNGYLHIGHAKSICTNFGLALKYGGRCHLRFDDTNPSTEETEYVESIQNDVKWLGFSYGEHLYYASDYFDQLYEWAELLINKGLAFVDSQNADEMKANRGTLHRPGTDSPYRTRTPEENLALFREMRDGKHPNGSHVLRAKINMAHPNMNMRDPPIYRILHKSHHRSGDKWCIYPLYDYAHGEEDAIEGITHSICTLEFEAHRELYNWFTANLPIDPAPHQFEFARLNVTNTVMSKRKLLKLVQEKIVEGWDDPRMPTICGLRRRGVRPEALRAFCANIGVTKNFSCVDVGLLEQTIREDLEPICARRLAVLSPLKVVIVDYPDDKIESIDAPNHTQKPELGTRKVTFSKNIWIERDDFAENPPPGYIRLQPGGEVKLRFAYVIKVADVIKDSTGEVTELRCTHDASTRDTLPTDRKVKGVIQWVSAAGVKEAKAVRLYDYLLKEDHADGQAEEEEAEDEDSKKDDFFKKLNPNSLTELTNAKLEASLGSAAPMERFQFERAGFFVADKNSKKDELVFNRIVGLKESAFKPDRDEHAAARGRKEEQMKHARELEAKKLIDPKDMFRGETALYSAFDDDGVPTHAADGSALPKKRIKKLQTEWEKQKKLFCAGK